MANTPQAKKRIRRNAVRETINHSRVSRIRSFIKAVDSQEHGRPEVFAAVKTGCIAGLKVPLKDAFERAVGRLAVRPDSGPSKKCSNSGDSRSC